MDILGTLGKLAEVSERYLSPHEKRLDYLQNMFTTRCEMVFGPEYKGNWEELLRGGKDYS